MLTREEAVPGALVECIETFVAKSLGVVKGAVYNVSGTHDGSYIDRLRGTPWGVCLVGVSPSPTFTCLDPRAFRPVRPEALSVFRAMLQPIKQTTPA